MWNCLRTSLACHPVKNQTKLAQNEGKIPSKAQKGFLKSFSECEVNFDSLKIVECLLKNQWK